MDKHILSQYIFPILPIRDVMHMCMTNKRYHELWADKGFWQSKISTITRDTDVEMDKPIVDDTNSERAKYRTLLIIRELSLTTEPHESHLWKDVYRRSHTTYVVYYMHFRYGLPTTVAHEALVERSVRWVLIDMELFTRHKDLERLMAICRNKLTTYVLTNHIFKYGVSEWHKPSIARPISDELYKRILDSYDPDDASATIIDMPIRLVKDGMYDEVAQFVCEFNLCKRPYMHDLFDLKGCDKYALASKIRQYGKGRYVLYPEDTVAWKHAESIYPCEGFILCANYSHATMGQMDESTHLRNYVQFMADVLRFGTL